MLTALLATSAAIAAGGESSIDAKLRVTDKRIQAGDRTGLIVKNTGERRILYGLGAVIEHREGGRWVQVPLNDCRRGCEVPDIGLVASPGEKEGPRYGSLRDVVRLDKDVAPGRYRFTKEIRNHRHPRRDRERIHEVIRIR